MAILQTVVSCTPAEIRERFETVGSSLFCLFEIMTLEGWTDYARPMLHRSPGWVMYFISFIFVSAFFLLNLVCRGSAAIRRV